MTLQPPPTDDDYYDLNSLIKSVNEFAGAQGYAVVKKRTQVSKKGVLRKAVLMCDRGGNYEAKGHGIRRGNTTIKTDCPFQAIASLGPDDMWHLTVKEPNHNHESSAPISHPSLRKSFMTPQILETIETQSNLNVPPQKIIAGLRVGGDDEDPKFLTKDIYNAKASMKRKNLGSLTPIQALLRNLELGDWYYEHAVNDHDQV